MKELEQETCGILHERTAEEGDNGGCRDVAWFTCAQCGLSVCEWHCFSLNGQMVCAICYGVEGYERRTTPVAMESEA